jgi:hypothetical protein
VLAARGLAWAIAAVWRDPRPRRWRSPRAPWCSQDDRWHHPAPRPLGGDAHECWLRRRPPDQRRDADLFDSAHPYWIRCARRRPDRGRTAIHEAAVGRPAPREHVCAPVDTATLRLGTDPPVDPAEGDWPAVGGPTTPHHQAAGDRPGSHDQADAGTHPQPLRDRRGVARTSEREDLVGDAHQEQTDRGGQQIEHAGQDNQLARGAKSNA